MDKKQTFLEAITVGDAEKVKELLQREPALVDSKNAAGESATLLAIYNGQPAIAELLVEQGAKLNIFEASAFGDEFEVITHLAEDQGIVNAYSHDGWTPLHLAAFFGHREVAELLLMNGADTELPSKNAKLANANMPLHAAATTRKADIVDLLLQNGANVNAEDGDGRMPLHIAAHHGDTELATVLLEAGADVNAQIEEGTPLTIAESQGHAETANFLRRHGADQP